MLEIKFDSDLPIYEQIKRGIVIDIAKGRIKKGDRLPSIRRLAEDLGVNLHTVRKSYNELKDEGYLTIDRQLGTVVSDDFYKGVDDFKLEKKEDLLYFIADAKNRGLSEKEITDICKEIYKEY